jgi:transcriptional regulator with XRE-family HTH domain
VKAIREEKNISQVAAVAGERGSARAGTPTLDALRKLAIALSVSADTSVSMPTSEAPTRTCAAVRGHHPPLIRGEARGEDGHRGHPPSYKAKRWGGVGGPLCGPLRRTPVVG